MAFQPKTTMHDVSQQQVPSPSNLPEIQVTSLPSQFKSYGKDAKISYVPYLYGELVRFNQSKMSDEEKCQQVLSGIRTSFDRMDLTFPDFLFLGLLRRMSTFGSNKFNISFVCQSCGNRSTIQIMDSEIEFDDLNIPALPVVVTLSNSKELHFGPLTVRDYFDLLRNEKTDDEEYVMAKQVKNFNDQEALEVINGITGKDISLLQHVDRYLYHGIKDIPTECRNEECKARVLVEIGEDSTLIYPFRESKPASRDAIRFGV